MKLRNKKTGDAVYVDFQIPLCNNNEVLGAYSVTSLKELNERFEDYKPAEPLIKDEKIRKAVRAWAEANDYSLVKIGYDMASEPNDGHVQIHFEGSDIVDEDKYGVHTIAELCGEEGE